ncbi:MAG: outer membrane lipoprotein chaperone LolA [Amphritea sp.]
MTFRKILTAFVLVSASIVTTLSPTHAEIGVEGSKQLAGLLGGFESFSADFDQVSAGSESRKMEQAHGSLVMAKPNRFNWIAKEPFPQQLISDGEFLWIYDPDLEQATRKKLDLQQNGVPALILNGQIDELQESYSIRLIHETADSQLFELLPFDEQSMFTRIRLLFNTGLITELQLEDSLGQRTSILFKNQQLNPQLNNNAFSFTPPDGIDVIIEDSMELTN